MMAARPGRPGALVQWGIRAWVRGTGPRGGRTIGEGVYADYARDVWAQWSGVLLPFAGGLIALVSRDIAQR